MCGIVGYISHTKHSKNDHFPIINKMMDKISHRGPDGSGIWIGEDIGLVLGHRRLSIIDTSLNGKQPMISSNRRYIITYNGEIYNHKNIQIELEKNYGSLNLKGHSDTEIILKAIEIWGLRVSLSKFIGMFAFALWDRKLSLLSLARDRFGEKPLYYGVQKSTFMFGSEIKALKGHPSFQKEIDRNTLPLLLRHNCVPAPYSIYKGIKKLKPGHYLNVKIDSNSFKIAHLETTYYDIKKQYSLGSIHLEGSSTESALDKLDTILHSSIKRQMISDVPLGIFLSGGVDSALIASIAQSQSQSKIKTFTIGNYDTRYNEAKYAKNISDHLQTDHNELYIDAKDAISVIPKLSEMYDEPFSDSSQIPTFLVSKLAREKVTVALSGDGGDEIFGGYNRYLMVPKIWNQISFFNLFFRNIISKLLLNISYNNLNFLYNNLNKLFRRSAIPIDFGERIHKIAELLPSKDVWQIYYTLCSHWKNMEDVILRSKEYPTKISKFNYNGELDIASSMMFMDMQTFLPDDILVKVDRASMANSLEVRAPFLDHRVFEFGAALPLEMKIRNGESKWLLKQLLYRYVPKELFVNRKMGFSVPLGEWLRGPLKDWSETLLAKDKLLDEGFFNVEEVRKKWKQHIDKTHNWQYQLWDVLMFQSWYTNAK